MRKLSAFNRRHRGLAYVLPSIVVILMVMFFPLIYSLLISLHSWNLQAASAGWKYVGLDNYVNALKSHRFQMGLLQTAKITIPALTFSMLFGLGLALLINRRTLPGRGLIVSLLVTPVMIAPAAVAMMWRLLLQVEYGGVNGLLQYGFGITNLPDWLGNPKTAIWVLSALDVWASTAFVMMILLAGLSSIPEELYEAARVDGAKAVASFRYITLPLLRTPLIVAFVMRFLSLIRIFDLPYALTAGGPGSSTETVALYTFMVGLRFLRIGDGAAMSLLILFVAFILATLYFKLVPLQKKDKVANVPK